MIPAASQIEFVFTPMAWLNETSATEPIEYDALRRCLCKWVKRPTGSVWRRSYHWSGEGELRWVEDSLMGDVRHEYDLAYCSRRRFIEGLVEDYGLDRADNLIQQPGLSEVELRWGNRISRANGSGFDYNDRNNVAVRQTSDWTVRYTYDSRDQLIQVEMPRGIWKAEYDALGRRVRKIWSGQTMEYF